LNFSDGEEDEDDEGISERSLRRTPSDDGKNKYFKEKKKFSFYFQSFIASQDSDYCTEDFNLMNETDVW
jgi:hypothetical protein